MSNTILLVMFVSVSLMVPTQATWTDVKDRIKNRVIHVENLHTRGRWLWQNDNHDHDGSKYLWIKDLNERDTYYEPRVQFQTIECGEYLCMESLSLPDYYLTAGYPFEHVKHTVKLQYSTYIQGDNRFFWKVLCTDNTLEKCKFVPIRFESEGYLMVREGDYGGYYDATLGKDESKAYFRVHAPNPTDGFKKIYQMKNDGSIEQKVRYETKMGVTQTQETSGTVTSTVSVEIGCAFQAFSASVSSSISTSWTTADSSTYEQSKTVEHDITIPARAMTTLYQLIGHYTDEFDVGDDVYMIAEAYLLTGRKSVRYIIHGIPSSTLSPVV